MSTKSPANGGAWARVAIFIALYALLLESVIEWVLVIYLYAMQRVDTKMMPSMILPLVASFCTVPLAVLHSLAAWQYNKVVGFGDRKTSLHAACTYLLRLTVAVWLASSVAGLVVVAQQASCLPEGADGSFWEVGISCGLHRTVFIVSVVSFLTICVFFCARELCDRPYDVSLLGVYKQHQQQQQQQSPNRDESIFSNTSWESESTLKNDVVCLCRHPEGSTCQPSVKHSAPTRPKPALTLNTGPDTQCAASPCESATRSFLDETSAPSRTPTLITSPPLPGQDQAQISPAELPSSPSTPNGVNTQTTTIPLSADPQIRALSDPSQREKQPNPSSSPSNQHPEAEKGRTSSDAPEVVSAPELAPVSKSQSQSQKHPKIRRAYTSHIPLPPPPPHPESISYHPNYVPPYPRPQKQVQSPPQIQAPLQSHPRTPPSPTYTPSPSSNPNYNYNFYATVPDTLKPRPQTAPSNPSFRRSQTNPTYHGPGPGRHHGRRSQAQLQTLLQGQNQGPGQSQLYTINGTTLRRPPRRSSTQRLRKSGNSDVDLVYPSTRRPRSATGYTDFPKRLDSITEVPAAAGDGEGEGGGEKGREDLEEGSVYRGADRTSFCGGMI